MPTRFSIRSREHYSSALDSVWGAWTDSDIRQWLSENGCLEGRDDVENRKELVDLINSKLSARPVPHLFLIVIPRYPDASAKVTSYLVWPDARLRAYLRERGVSENALPTSRPGLLRTSDMFSPYSSCLNVYTEETRIRWVQITSRTGTIFAKLQEIINSSVEAVEGKVARVLEVCSVTTAHSAVIHLLCPRDRF